MLQEVAETKKASGVVQAHDPACDKGCAEISAQHREMQVRPASRSGKQELEKFKEDMKKMMQRSAATTDAMINEMKADFAAATKKMEENSAVMDTDLRNVAEKVKMFTAETKGLEVVREAFEVVRGGSRSFCSDGERVRCDGERAGRDASRDRDA